MKIIPKDMEQYKFPVLSAGLTTGLSFGLIWFLKIVDSSFSVSQNNWYIGLTAFGITFVLAMLIQYINNQELYYIWEESVNMLLLLVASGLIYSLLPDLNFIPFTMFAGIYYMRTLIKKGGI